MVQSQELICKQIPPLKIFEYIVGSYTQMMCDLKNIGSLGKFYGRINAYSKYHYILLQAEGPKHVVGNTKEWSACPYIVQMPWKKAPQIGPQCF